MSVVKLFVEMCVNVRCSLQRSDPCTSSSCFMRCVRQVAHFRQEIYTVGGHNITQRAPAPPSPTWPSRIRRPQETSRKWSGSVQQASCLCGEAEQEMQGRIRVHAPLAASSPGRVQYASMTGP